MTEFETQVAEALQIALLVEKWGKYPIESIATDLAPRVAAAIDAASQQVIGLPEVLPRGREKALVALRGETP